MTTTIDNTQRVFQIATSTGEQVFCNLDFLPHALIRLGCPAKSFKRDASDTIGELTQITFDNDFDLYHFWNNRQMKMSKVALNGMLQHTNYRIK